MFLGGTGCIFGRYVDHREGGISMATMGQLLVVLTMCMAAVVLGLKIVMETHS